MYSRSCNSHLRFKILCNNRCRQLQTESKSHIHGSWHTALTCLGNDFTGYAVVFNYSPFVLHRTFAHVCHASAIDSNIIATSFHISYNGQEQGKFLANWFRILDQQISAIKWWLVSLFVTMLCWWKKLKASVPCLASGLDPRFPNMPRSKVHREDWAIFLSLTGTGTAGYGLWIQA